MRTTAARLLQKAPLLIPAGLTALGIAFADQSNILWLIVGIVLFTALLCQKREKLALLSLCLFCLSHELHRTQISEQKRWQNLTLNKHECTIRAEVTQLLRKDFHGHSAIVRLIDSPMFAKIFFLANTHDTSLRTGDTITCTVRTLPHKKARNPGIPDFSKWHWRSHTACVIDVLEIHQLTRRKRHQALQNFTRQLRHNIAKIITQGLKPNSSEQKVILGVTLGQKRNGDAITESFRNSGALHIFAVSGMHVGMIAGICLFTLRLIGLRKIHCCWLLIPLLFLYAMITGFSAPTARAATMISLILIAYGLRKQAWAINAIAMSAIAFLLWDTHQLFHAGFQLSYCLLFVFLTIGKRVDKTIRSAINHDDYLPRSLVSKKQHIFIHCGRWVAGLVSISVIASIASSPLTFTHFSMVTPIAALTSILVIPQAFFVLSFSMASLLTSFISTPLNNFINQGNAHIAKAMIATVEICADIPGSHVRFSESIDEHDVVVFDLQGSNSILLNGPAPLLIDCGSRKDFSRTLLPALHGLGISPTQLFITHSGGDATGGGSQILKRFPIERVYLSDSSSRSPYARALKDYIKAQNLTQEISDEILLGEHSSLKILHQAIKNQQGRADDRSAILQLKHFGNNILFTSDSGFFTEKYLLDQKIDLKSDILIMSRHSSDFSGTDEFIDAVAPKAIIASHRPFSENEGIPKDWEKRVREKGIKLYHQGKSGGIVIKTTENGFLIQETLTPR